MKTPVKDIPSAFLRLELPAPGGYLPGLLLALSLVMFEETLASASAQNVDSWTGGSFATANFSDPANWVSGAAPVSGDYLVFGVAGGSGAALNNDLTSYTFGGIAFTNGASAYTIGGNAFTLTNGITNYTTTSQIINTAITLGGNVTVTNAGGTVSLGVDGTGLDIMGDGGLGYGFTKNGAGTLLIGNNANTFTGNIVVSNGILSFTGTGTQTVANTPLGSATLLMYGGTFRAGSATAISNNLVAEAGTSCTLDTSANFTYYGNITGSGTIARGTVATDSLYLAGDNTGFTGTFTIPNNGNAIIRMFLPGDGTNAGSKNAIWINNLGTASRGPTLDWPAPGGTVQFGSFSGTGNALANNIAGTALVTNVVQTGYLGLNDLFTGNINNIVGGGAAATAKLCLEKWGAGTFTLSGTSTYTGYTLIGSGTLQIGNAGTTGNLASPLITNNSALAFNYKTTTASTFPSAAGGIITGTGTLTYTNAGTVPMKLISTNTYAGNTTILGGILQLGIPQALPGGPGLGNVIVNSGGTLDLFTNSPTINGLSGSGIVNNSTNAGPVTLTVGSNDVTSAFSGVIENTGGVISLVKVGAGDETLSGPNTYSGNTTVSDGELDLPTEQTGTGGIIAYAGTTLGVVVNSSTSLSTSALTETNNSMIISGVNSTSIPAVNATALAPYGTVTISVSGSFVQGSQYPLIQFTSYTGTGGFAIGTLPAGTTATIVTNGGNTIALNVTAAAPAIWKGSLSAKWDINTTANWTLNGTPSVYVDGQTVQFDDTGAGNVNISQPVSPGGVRVNNNSVSYVVSTTNGNGIAGGTGITMTGTGSLTLSGLTNTYTGLTTISNGTLVVDRDNDLGNAASGLVINGGTLSSPLKKAGFFAIGS